MTHGCTDCGYAYIDECEVYEDGTCRRDRAEAYTEETNNMTFNEAKEKLLADDNVRREYETLDEEYEHIKADLRKIASKNPTGKERLERLYKRLKKNFPNAEIIFSDESLHCDPIKYFGYKVAYFIDGVQVCDAIWSFGSYGSEKGLLEFYYNDEPEGWITERRAYNLFKEAIEAST